MSFSPQQDDALVKIKEWWNDGNPEEQEFLLFGYAGTGKTTLAKELTQLLGLEMFVDPKSEEEKKENQREGGSQYAAQEAIIYCAFTGKAALVLRRKGLTSAYTIHQTIYGRPFIDEMLADQLREKIEVMEARGGDPDLASTRRELSKVLQPSFSMSTTASRGSAASLIVVDECSMVTEQLYRDLLSLKKPIIFMGDPAQLPPVGKSAGLIDRRPNVMLTEIHRQAADNPILILATSLRQNSALPQIFDPNLVVTRDQIEPKEMLDFDQVIIGYHNTRRRLNNQMRRLKGFDVLPEGNGEKLINLKNQHDIGIMNGEMVQLKEVDPKKALYFFQAKLANFETGDLLISPAGRETHLVYDGYFYDTEKFQEGRIDRDWRKRQDSTELDWGYAITCHKSQGSEWDTVFIHDDGFGRSEEDRRRWLYTALTRARSKAMISSRFAI